MRKTIDIQFSDKPLTRGFFFLIVASKENTSREVSRQLLNSFEHFSATSEGKLIFES